MNYLPQPIRIFFKLAMALSLAFTLTTYHSSALAKTTDKTLIVTCDQWPGTCEKNGSGFYLDIIRAIYEPKGYTISYRIDPFKRGLKLIREGKADIMAAAYKTTAREKHYHYPQIRLITEYVTALRLSSTAKIKNYKANGKVTFIRGYEYHPYIDNAKVEEIGRVDQGLKMILSKRSDYFINPFYDSYMRLLEISSEENELDWQQLAFDYIDSSPIYLLFQKNQRGSELAEIYDQKLPELHHSGVLESILSQQSIGKYYYFYPEITGPDSKAPIEVAPYFSIPEASATKPQ